MLILKRFVAKSNSDLYQNKIEESGPRWFYYTIY